MPPTVTARRSKTIASDMTFHLRLGVVGYGNRGVIAQRAAELDGDAAVVAVADPSEHGHERAMRDFGSSVVIGPDIATLIEAGVDAAFVTTPDHLHAEHVTALLEAGIPTFVDKPLATTLDDADRILDTAYRTGTRLYVGHNMRLMPVFTTMHRLIQEGAIGEVKAVWCRHFIGDGGDRFFKDWHADRTKVGSLLLQKGSHDLDIIHLLAGGYADVVTGMGGETLYNQIDDRMDRSGQVVREWLSREDNWPPLSQKGMAPVMDVEDLSMVHMHLDNGVYASYEECHYTPDYWRNYTVIGTEGRMENFGMSSVTGVIRIWNTRTEYNPVGDIEVPIPEAEGGHNGADPILFEEFFAFVREGRPTKTSPVAGRNAVAAAALATESLRDGSTPQRIPPVREEVLRHFAEQSL